MSSLIYLVICIEVRLDPDAGSIMKLSKAEVKAESLGFLSTLKIWNMA